jgi:hypothetical protein
MEQNTFPQALTGHESAETAYLVGDYPYGYTLRTQIRYWREYRPKYGYRFVSQTLNPKTGKWNKPKASTYYELMVIVQYPENGHIKYKCVGYHDKTEWLDEFERRYSHTFNDHDRDQLAWLRAARSAESKVTYEIVRGPTYSFNYTTGRMEMVDMGDRPDGPNPPTIDEQARFMHNLTASEYISAKKAQQTS